MIKYTIVINRPGFLPEADPIELEIDESGERGHEAEQLLQAIWNEVDRFADEEDDGWIKLLDEIDDNLEHAADFDPRGGFLYVMPDGYVIEATFVK
jgi:hypothetical protein